MLSAKKLAGSPPFGAEERTVTASVVVCVTLPDFPEIVTVEVPTVADELAVSVRVLWVVVLVGLNDAVTPDGRPEAERVTALAESATVTVALPTAPC